MFALVENNAFVRIVNSNTGITIGSNQYPKSIFRLWTNSEREAIGIYEVTMDNTNRKDEAYYINTNVTYSYSNGSVTGSYGTATAKSLADTLYTQDDDDNDRIPDGKSVGDVAQEGLKTLHKKTINAQANGLLSKYDWYVIRKTEDSTKTIPSDVSTFRTNVRTKANDMCTKIDNASDVDALSALYVRASDGTRPLGDFPEEV